MSASLYADLQNVSSEMIREFGRDVTITGNTYGTYDPANGTPPATTASATVKAAVFDVEERMIDGAAIQRGDRRLLISGRDLTAFTPQPEDAVTIGAAKYRIKHVKTTNPGGVTVLYELIIRNG